MCEQLTTAATCALRSTMDQVRRIESEGIDHSLRHCDVLISTCMARRGQGDHLTIKNESSLIGCGEHRDRSEGFDRAA